MRSLWYAVSFFLENFNLSLFSFQLSLIAFSFIKEFIMELNGEIQVGTSACALVSTTLVQRKFQSPHGSLTLLTIPLIKLIAVCATCSDML